MKKLLSSALSAAMVIALVASTAVVVGAEETKQPDYDKYVSEELAPKYGYASIEDMTKTFDLSDISDESLVSPSSNGWSKRTGILGYDVVDMNSDSKDDLLVYYFANDTDVSTLKVDFFTTDENAQIYKADSITLASPDGVCMEYCMGGIAEWNGNDYLYVETGLSGILADGVYFENNFYTCDENNKLVIDYSIKQSGMGGGLFDYELVTRNTDGEYDTEIVWDFYSEKSRYEALLGAYEKIGFYSTDYKVIDLMEYWGYKNYEDYFISDIPTYFYDGIIRNDFNVVCAPVDMDNISNNCEFKSMIDLDEYFKEDSTEVDIEKYVHDVIVPTYGCCSVDDMTRTFSVSEVSKLDPLVDGWSKRTGMLGYDVVDINGDSKDDLLVYYFADDTDINTLKVDLFTTDKNGEFGKTDSIILDSQNGLFMEYCVGGITELNGKNYLCVETGHSGVFSNGVYFENNFYTCDENNKLVIDYSIKQSGEGSSLYNYQLVTRNSDGEYDTEMIWDFDSEEDRKEALLGAYEKIGFSSTDYKLSDLFSYLGYKNYEEYFVSGMPTYFYGNGNMISEFNVICAPIDMSIPEGGVKTREFKSIVSFNTDCYEDIDKVESNVSSTESNTNSDVTSDESTASTNSTVSNTSSQNSSTSSKNTSTATSKTTSTNTVKSVDTVKTAGLISVIGLIAVLFVAGVVVVTVKKKADKE